MMAQAVCTELIASTTASGTMSRVQHCTVVPSMSAIIYYIKILLKVLAEAPGCIC